MKIKADHKSQYVEAGSKQCASLLRVSRDPWLRIEWQAEQARLREAWSEAQHIKSVKRLEREFECRRQARGRGQFWLRTKAKNWGGEQGKKYKSSTSSRAIRMSSTRGWMPRYTRPIRTAKGLLLPFQRTLYRSAKSSKQGAAKDLVRYGADGAHEFDDGASAFYSSVGRSVEETAEAFDQLERVNRSAAANAKVVHHMIIQSLHELPPEAQWEMLLRYCDQVFGSQDLPYSVCLHAPSEAGDQRNWHAHVVFSYRPMVRTGEAEWQIGRAIRTDLDCPEHWTRMRFLLSEELNRTAEMHAIDKRYTHLSYAAAGLDYIPQEHLGPGLTEKVRRGEKVALNEQNLAVVARNSALQAVREMRSALLAGVAAVAEYARKERDIILAAMSIQPASSVKNSAAFGIRGVRIPAMPSALNAGGRGDDFGASNDDIAAPDRREASSRLGIRVMVAKPLEARDNASTGTSNLTHSPPPTLPQDLVGPDVGPIILHAQAPVPPDVLIDAVPQDTLWKAPSAAPAMPLTLSEDDEEETPYFRLLDTRATAAPKMPEPLNVEDTKGFYAIKLGETAPRLPTAVSKIAEGFRARTPEIFSSGARAPQLPDELGPGVLASSSLRATWSLLPHVPFPPPLSLRDPDTGSSSSRASVASMPSEPGWTSPSPDLETDFSRLKPDGKEYPDELSGRSNSDEVGRSSLTIRSADGAARLEGPNNSEKRQQRDGEPKSNQASQPSKGLPPWLVGDPGEGVQ